MGEALGFMAVAGILGGISGGMNARKAQEKIKHKVCNLYRSMRAYQKNMSLQETLLEQENQNLITETQKLAEEIGFIQDDLREQKSSFKKRYDMWVVVGVIFLIILIFIFASKKVILHATTEKS